MLDGTCVWEQLGKPGQSGSAGADIGVDLVDPWPGFGQGNESRGCQQGDYRSRMFMANCGKGWKTLHEITECPKPDDEDTEWIHGKAKDVMMLLSGVRNGALVKTCGRLYVRVPHVVLRKVNVFKKHISSDSSGPARVELRWR